MTSGEIFKSSAEAVSEIVDKTRVLVDRLRCAIIHQDNVTKDCFDTNATELSKTVESIKKSYLKLDEEYKGVKEEIQMGEKRLNDILAEHKVVVEDNARLKVVEDGFLNPTAVANENRRLAKELRETIHAYKLLTGVRFDYCDSADALSGYIAISGNKPPNNTVIPFEIGGINGGNTDKKRLLWDEINEASLEINK